MNAKIIVLLVTFIINSTSSIFVNGPSGNSENSKRNSNLKTPNISPTAVDLDVNLLNVPLKFIFDSTGERVGRRHEICDDFILFRSPGGMVKFRKLPKGMCESCCKIQSTDITFTLHHTKSQDKTLLYLQDIVDKKSLNLLKNAHTVIYVHGFLEHPPIGSTGNIRDVYLAREEATNVILVDWSQLCAFPWYLNAIENTRIVGRILAKFLTVYNELGEINVDQVHLIGFSLGAQVVGYAGKYIQEAGLKIRRITGLDPAFPGYQGGPSTRLSKADADFVDIIHTDGGSFGDIRQLGHVDFYPNDGTHYQPGCSYREQIRRNALGNIISCSHARAVRYYAESVLNPTNFPAVKCKWIKNEKVCDRNTVAYMGIASNKRDEGTFYLTTNEGSPYGRSEVIL